MRKIVLSSQRIWSSEWRNNLFVRAPICGVQDVSTILTCMRSCITTAPETTGRKSRKLSTSLTAVEFSQIAPMVLLRQALRQHTGAEAPLEGAAKEERNGNVVISRELFSHYCSESHVRNSDDALRLLAESGSVVSISNGEGVHLRPVQFLHTYEDLSRKGDSTGQPGEFFLEEAMRRVKAAEREEAEMRLQLKPALERTSRWRRLVWGGALCFSGAQLAIISRLTFFEFDWDTMEPISYFLGTGTSIVFFFYFLRYGRSHSYNEYDRTKLPIKLKKYAPPEFDWKKYEEICRKVDDERRMLNKIKEWVRRH